MNIIDQMNKETEEAGAAAYHRGVIPEGNPHVRGTPEHEIWFSGWCREADADPKRDH